MLLNSFKVSGFKVFGDLIELNLNAGTKNRTYLKDNLIEYSISNQIYKNVKTSIVYGGNNTGKSSLLDALIMMKEIFIKGTHKEFIFEKDKNFCFEYDDIIRFEVDFNDEKSNYVYGFEFFNYKNIGEYLFVGDKLAFSRDLDGGLEGYYLEKIAGFKEAVKNLTNDKLIVTYFLEYQKDVDDYYSFKVIKKLFDKIIFLDSRRDTLNVNVLNDFMRDIHKVKILNELIKSTELYLEGRTLISEDELINSMYFGNFLKSKEFEKLNEQKGFKSIIDSFKVHSLYKTKGGGTKILPSLIFDSIGTNKFLNLTMYIINALLGGNILLIDEFDSSLHHKLTRVLVILMNSEANTNSQFILTTHDVNLLSSDIFRKDQINFVVRTSSNVEIVSLDDFKANSETDIRKNSNFEKMYVEEKIIPLPETNIYRVIKELLNEEK